MEFGSDFHRIKNLIKGHSILNIIGECNLYTDGRQALEDILINNTTKRVWLPSYYCHESVQGVRKLGIEVLFYPCTPLSDQDNAIKNLPLGYGDALVRMNYFGLQEKPRTPYGNFIIIEDHSHNPISDWALDSDADWCFASLRKTLPIPDGGILWSPIRKALPPKPRYSQLAFHNSFRRNAAMEMKTNYLAGKINKKDDFLSEFRITEENIGFIPISSISNVAKEIVGEIDIKDWYNRKKLNWATLKELLVRHSSFDVLLPETENEIPFSLVLLFKNHNERERVRQKLISDTVYPAVLWSIPDGNDKNSIDFGERILSIHCDARYSTYDMEELAYKINKAITNDQIG